MPSPEASSRRWDSREATPQFGTVAGMSDILNINLDELAGTRETDPEARIHNPELHRLYRKVGQLSDEDRKALVVVPDSLVKRAHVARVMAEGWRRATGSLGRSGRSPVTRLGYHCRLVRVVEGEAARAVRSEADTLQLKAVDQRKHTGFTS